MTWLAAADLQVEKMGLLLVSAVGRVRPTGVKTQKKHGRTVIFRLALKQRSRSQWSLVGER